MGTSEGPLGNVGVLGRCGQGHGAGCWPWCSIGLLGQAACGESMKSSGLDLETWFVYDRG